MACQWATRNLMAIHFLLFGALISSAAASHGHDKNHYKAISNHLLRKSILAPSWEFRGIDHKWNWKKAENKDAETEALAAFVQEFKRSYEFTKNQLITMFGRESFIECRLKPIASIKQELDDDGNRTVKDIDDIVTWRITFPTVKQLLQARSRFLANKRFSVAIVECYGVCPKAGKYATTGYRGITLLAVVGDKPTEIQLVTPYMVMWADWAYSVLIKGSISLHDKDVTKYALELAEYYYNLDESRNKLPACPKPLLNTKMRTKAKKNKMFETLGGPPTACQFWNDLNVNKNTDFVARRKVLDVLDEHASGSGKSTENTPTAIDIDKILKPENLKDSKDEKRSFHSPVHYYY